MIALFARAEPSDADDQALPKLSKVGEVGGDSGESAICDGLFSASVTRAYTGNRKTTAVAISTSSRR